MIKKLMKKFLLPLIDKSFSFSPKKPFQILAERRVSRREATSANLHFPNWLAIVDEFRTPKWIESIKYPELIMQQVKQFLYAH